ncbi:hypothetical protein BgiBS90_016903, partial [Biomphalaria glabrata]
TGCHDNAFPRLSSQAHDITSTLTSSSQPKVKELSTRHEWLNTLEDQLDDSTLVLAD